MKVFKYSSLKFKITAMMLIVTTLIIGIGFSFVIINNVKKMRSNMLDNISMHVKLIGEYCVSPLIFDDKRGTKELLSRFNSVPIILNANLYDSQNEFYTSFQKDSLNQLGYPNFKKGTYHFFENDHLYVCEPIIYKEVKYGSLFVKVSTDLLVKEIHSHIWTMTFLICILFIIAIFLINWFQRIITSPILVLAKTMKLISEQKDYSIRIHKDSMDEIGILYDGFNNMLGQIQSHESERDKANERLKSAKEQAEESDELKSAFLANMSHEIRTPMNAIIGFSELLSNTELSSKKKTDYIKYINKSSQTLLALVNDIIDISKIEASQLSIQSEKCDINKLLRELYITFEETKKSYYESTVELRYIEPSENITILSDSVRIKQIVTNFLSNALKFTEKGYIEFSAFLNKEILTIYVKDTGLGMTPEQQSVVFERFRKVINENNEKLYRGAGLGLAICKSLAQLLGGEIGVDSQLGKGSRFFLRLPCILIENNKKNKHAPLPQNYIYDWSGKTILIAEDEETNYKYLEAVITKTGANIIWTKNGEEAIRAAEQNSDVSVVLMDIKMPKINGYDATRKIKKTSNIPIISLTAYAMADEKQKCFQAGCDDYLVKPVAEKHLLYTISKYIEN